MIQILGFRRVITLAILIAVNLALAGALYSLILPQKDKVERELRTTRSAVNARRTEVATLKNEYEQIQEQKNLFENLQNAGFFTTQDRINARKTIEQIQRESKVLAARYDIQAIQVQENPAAATADHVLLHSPMKFSLDALDDIDVYSFMYWAQNAFPGQVGIDSVTIERKLDVDEITLKQIGTGRPVVLVSATVDFSWNTMVPRTQLPEQLNQPGIPQ